MTLTLNVSAPNLSNDIKQKQKLELIKLTHVKRTEASIEKEQDLKDLKVLKKLGCGMEKRFTFEDRKKVRQICKRLGIKPEWLYVPIRIESKGYVDSLHSRNPYSYATGLIGFLPSTAKNLGTSTKELEEMTVSEQLDYVEKYFIIQSNGRKMKSVADVYFMIFRPSVVNQSDSFVISSKSSKGTKNDTVIYHQNPGLITNKADTVLTVKAIKTVLGRYII
jgi:hypothetical protein